MSDPWDDNVDVQLVGERVVITDKDSLRHGEIGEVVSLMGVDGVMGYLVVFDDNKAAAFIPGDVRQLDTGD